MFHDPVRRAEQTLGILAGALTLIAITIGALVPISSSTFSVHEGARLVQYSHTTTNLFQFLGRNLADSIIYAFITFAVVFASAAILHAHEDDPAAAKRWLAGEWIAGMLLIILAIATSNLFVYLFIPSVVLVIATLVVSTRRHFTAARA